MSLTPSKMLPLDTAAPDFDLPDAVSGKRFGLKSFADAPALVVMFICNHCPFVIHVRDEITRLSTDYASMAFVAISSNDVENYPDDAPEHMKSLARELGWNFPYLFDEDQSVARAYDAACTPDYYVFDGERRLAYRGRLDASRPESGVPVTGEDLRVALDAVLRGERVEDQQPSMGCNIKWKQ
ncbi:thioredoxin family protein [bacterium]|nr:MAG: thioredoxin family protein [bacterium]